MNTVEVDVLKINTADAQKSMGNLKQELKDTKQQMIELRMRGEETSEAYKQLAQRAGDLSRAMKLANTDIAEASTTFSNTVSYVSGSLAGVSGAVQAATGALSLMGVEMGSDTKLMKMLVAAMSVTSGLTAIQASVEAFKKLATNIKRSTLAQQGLNAAMKANPVMFAVAGVAALTAGLIALTAKMKENKRAAEELAEKNKILVGTYRDLKAEMVTYEDELNMMDSGWYSKIIQRYKELNYAARGNGDILEQNIKQAAKAAVEHKKTAEKNLLVGVDMYRQWQRAQTDYNIAINNGYTDEEIAKFKATLDERKMALVSFYKEINKVKEKSTKTDDKTAENEEKQVKKILNSLKSAQEKELAELSDKYEEEKALLEKYGEDTKALTEKYENDQADIRQKYRDKEEEERKKSAQSSVEARRLEMETELAKDRWAIMISGEKDITKKLQELDEQAFNNERMLLKQQFDERLITQEEFENQLVTLEAEQAEKRRQIAEDEKNKKIEIQKAYVNSAITIANSLGGIFGSLADIMSEDTEATKNLRAAQAIINTIAGAVGAFMGITESTGGWGIAAAVAQAAAVLAAGYAEVKKIYAVDTSGGKNSTSSTGVSASAVNTLGQNYNMTQLVSGGGGVYDLSRLEQRSNTRVYVLTQDIQDGLDRVSVVQHRNTF